MIDEPFMQIRQALGTTLTRAPGTVRFLAAAIEELEASGCTSTRCGARARTSVSWRHLSRWPEPGTTTRPARLRRPAGIRLRRSGHAATTSCGPVPRPALDLIAALQTPLQRKNQYVLCY
jgi:hypothetical protein